jgi:hypothetical protein
MKGVMMKRLLILSSLVLALASASHAQTKISALPSATPIATDVVPFVSDPGGTPVTKKSTFSDLFSVITPSFIGSSNKNGNGSKFQLFTGSFSTNDCAKFDASGNIVTNGGTCAAAAPVQSVFGRTGAVVAATNDYNFNQLAGSVANSQMPALTGDVTTSAGTVATSIGTGKVTNAMLAGSIATSKLAAPSGNGGTVATTTGTLTSGHCVQIDASGNLIDAGSACGGIAIWSTGNSSGQSISGAGTSYGTFAVVGNSVTATAWNTAESLRQMLTPIAITLHDFCINTTTAQPSDGTAVYTVRDNGADTALTFTIAASGATGGHCDNTHSVNIAAGHLISFSIVYNGATASATTTQWAVAYNQ